jgi:hypothetical protein
VSAVRYGVTVRARRLWDVDSLADGWALTLDNGHTLRVGTLDDAPAAVRNYLDARQPVGFGGADHSAVEVVLTIEPESGIGDPTPAYFEDRQPVDDGTPVFEPAAEPAFEPVIEPVVEAPAEPEPAAEPVPAEASYAEPAATEASYAEPGGMELMLMLLSAREDAPDFASAATAVLPWISDLAGHHRPQCLADLRIALTTAANEYSYGDLESAVTRWKPGTRAVVDATPEPDPVDFLTGYPAAAYQSPRQREEAHYGADLTTPAPAGTDLSGAERPSSRHRAGRHRL